MIIAVGSIAVNALASYFFRDWLSHFGVTPETPHGYGHVGVALATSTVALVNFVALAVFMRRRIARLNGRVIASSFFRIAAASLLMSVISYASYYLLHSLLNSKGLLAEAIEAFIPIAIGGGVFLIAAKLFGVEELEKLYTSLMRKIRPASKPA
jgi:putative peptidoglycan lipid II flippase